MWAVEGHIDVFDLFGAFYTFFMPFGLIWVELPKTKMGMTILVPKQLAPETQFYLKK